MKKIAFIGGGSFGFTRSLVRDLLTFPAFRDAEIALMDIDEERLDYIKKACEKIVRVGNYPAKITATTDRIEALKDADGVLCTILAGDVDVWQYDITIPKKYGVDICIYGHIHNSNHCCPINDIVDGIKTLLVSCDRVDFCPVRLAI